DILDDRSSRQSLTTRERQARRKLRHAGEYRIIERQRYGIRLGVRIRRTAATSHKRPSAYEGGSNEHHRVSTESMAKFWLARSLNPSPAGLAMFQLSMVWNDVTTPGEALFNLCEAV